MEKDFRLLVSLGDVVEFGSSPQADIGYCDGTANQRCGLWYCDPEVSSGNADAQGQGG